MTFAEFINVLAKHGLEYFNKYYGIYRGIVEDNADPEKLGRLKLCVPQITGNKVIGSWAYGKGMAIGKDMGIIVLPEPGDPVWVSFENGDSRHPVWEHGWGFNNSSMGKAEDNSILLTRGKSKMELYKTGKVQITSDAPSSITMEAGGGIVIKDGPTEITIKDGKIALGSGDEVGLLGDSTIALLNDLITQIATSTCVAGSPLSNATAIAALAGELNTLRTEIVTVT